MHVVGRRGSVVVSAALKRDVTGAVARHRKTNICLSKVGEGERKESAMYD